MTATTDRVLAPGTTPAPVGFPAPRDECVASAFSVPAPPAGPGLQYRILRAIHRWSPDTAVTVGVQVRPDDRVIATTALEQRGWGIDDLTPLSSANDVGYLRARKMFPGVLPFDLEGEIAVAINGPLCESGIDGSLIFADHGRRLPPPAFRWKASRASFSSYLRPSTDAGDADYAPGPVSERLNGKSGQPLERYKPHSFARSEMLARRAWNPRHLTIFTEVGGEEGLEQANHHLSLADRIYHYPKMELQNVNVLGGTSRRVFGVLWFTLAILGILIGVGTGLAAKRLAGAYSGTFHPMMSVIFILPAVAIAAGIWRTVAGRRAVRRSIRTRLASSHGTNGVELAGGGGLGQVMNQQESVAHFRATFFGTGLVMSGVLAVSSAWVCLQATSLVAVFAAVPIFVIGSVAGIAWRQKVRRRPSLAALGGLAVALATATLLGHLWMRNYQEGLGIANPMDFSPSVVLAVMVRPLLITIAVGVVSFVLWFLFYRRRVAQPTNWILGLMFAVTATTPLAVGYDRAALSGLMIGSASTMSTHGYSATPVCVSPISDRPLNLGSLGTIGSGHSRQLWLVGTSGASTILMDPELARTRLQAWASQEHSETIPPTGPYAIVPTVTVSMTAGRELDCRDPQ